MKIVAGIYGGRRLMSPKNRDIRPTSDKVRASIFNMLASRDAIDGARVLDGFCGTGALGLEALSRGAESCHFVDKSRTSLALARENAGVLGIDVQGSYTLGDVRKVIAGHKNNESVQTVRGVCEPNLRSAKGAHNAYSLIFLDPPYRKNLITDVLEVFKGVDILCDGAWIVCESEREFSLPDIDGYRIENEKEYGDTRVILLQYESAYTGE